MANNNQENKYKRYTVTSALPYANGPIHIGHLAGVYVPADIYVRYQRAKKRDVLFIGGSDEHGVPIMLRASKENISPQQIVDHYHEMIKESFTEFGISFDIYSRTSSKTHHETAAEYFAKLYSENKFIEKEQEQYYDEEAKQFLADRYIVGTCPKCGFDKAYGDQCESCGTSLNASDLINPHSVLSGKKPSLKPTKHWYLPLNEYEPWLKDWILKSHKDDWKTNVYGQCKSWIEGGLHPRAVTRDLNWGVKLPIPNTEGKVLYVWFDAPIGYISASKEWSEKTGKDWKPYWKDADSKMVHFIGKDNIVFHCIIFPAMLKAEGSYILPDNVPANEFMNLEGDKISTSRNWAVWLHEYLQDFPEKQDVLRYVLTANAPETKDNDFTWKDFQTRNNSELVAVLGNFVNRTLVLAKKFFDNSVPPIDKLTEEDNATLSKIAEFPTIIGNAIENYHFREGLSELMNLARIGNKYLTDTEPWKLKDDKPRIGTILNISLQICANLSILARPFMPFTAEKLGNMLNICIKEWDKAGVSNILEPGKKINDAQLLFNLIEDSQIEAQMGKLQETKKENSAVNNATIKDIPKIDFTDFTKLNLVIATIVGAEKVPKTTKLLKLTVDLGKEKRTIVSGIAGSYTPEEVIGKQVLVLENLLPRNLKGITSEGMILMAESNNKLICISPEEKIENGAQVS